jgi:hypothetical protein
MGSSPTPPVAMDGTGAVTMNPVTQIAPEHYRTAEESREVFDRATHRYLGMSGDEFVAAWDAGEFEDVERPEVAQVVMLLPLVGRS